MARVVVTDTGGLDFAPGLAALETAGHDAVLLDEGADLTAHLAEAEGLIVSFRRIDADVIAAAPA